jgi:hypothetical protein
VFKVAYVGNVTHIAHLIALLLQVAEKEVEGNCGACVSEVGIAIHCGAAYVHPYVSGIDGLKLFLFAGQGVINCKHIVSVF